MVRLLKDGNCPCVEIVRQKRCLWCTIFPGLFVARSLDARRNSSYEEQIANTVLVSLFRQGSRLGQIADGPIPNFFL